MEIPHYWAEASLRHKQGGRQLTLRRWGWSQLSQEHAQELADRRVKAAMDDVLLTWPGKKGILRREPKVPYNGSEGVPIREEVIERNVDGAVSRNSYGAKCLNVDDVLFVDMDDEDLLRLRPGSVSRCAVVALLLSISVGIHAWFQPHLDPCNMPYTPWPDTLWSMFVSFALAWPLLLWLMGAWHKAMVIRSGSALGAANRAVRSLLAKNQAGSWRIYQTPAGARIMAMHDLFDPTSDDVQDLMKSMQVDPLYARMCRRQRCFRARVSAKPWRIPDTQRMRGPVWPVSGEALERRITWVEEYEAKSADFAACRFIHELGTGKHHPKARRVQLWHDDLSRACTGKPLA